MSLLRLVSVVALTTVVTTTGILLGAISVSKANADSLQPNIKAPYSFQAIFQNDFIILEADRSTFTGLLDEANDLAIGGIFKLTRKGAKPGEKAIFISANIALCGNNAIIVMHSRDFGVDGNPMGTSGPSAADVIPNTAIAATYEVLCGAGIGPTPFDKGYKADDRYTSFWAQ